MNVTIHSVEGKGDLDKEVVWLDVKASDDLGRYILADTTYTDDDHISNEIRHTFWFPTTKVNVGDWVAVHTKSGTKTATKNDRGGTTHQFYWGLGRTIWNKDGDCAVLLHVDNWQTKRV